MTHFRTQKSSFLRQKELLPMVLADFFHDIIMKTQISQVNVFDDSNKKKLLSVVFGSNLGSSIAEKTVKRRFCVRFWDFLLNKLKKK